MRFSVCQLIEISSKQAFMSDSNKPYSTQKIGLPKPYKAFGDAYCLDTRSPDFRTPLTRFRNFTYTESACWRDCYTRRMVEKCGCRFFFDPGMKGKILSEGRGVPNEHFFFFFFSICLRMMLTNISMSYQTMSCLTCSNLFLKEQRQTNIKAVNIKAVNFSSIQN